MRRVILSVGLATAVAFCCSTAFAQRGVGGPVGGNAGNAPANIERGNVVNPNVANQRIDANARTADRGRDFTDGGNRGGDWRYRFDNGRWWYWGSDNRWMYYNNNDWVAYNDGAYTANYASDPNEQFYNGYWWYWNGGSWLIWNGGQWIPYSSYTTYYNGPVYDYGNYGYGYRNGYPYGYWSGNRGWDGRGGDGYRSAGRSYEGGGRRR